VDARGKNLRTWTLISMFSHFPAWEKEILWIIRDKFGKVPLRWGLFFRSMPDVIPGSPKEYIRSTKKAKCGEDLTLKLEFSGLLKMVDSTQKHFSTELDPRETVYGTCRVPIEGRKPYFTQQEGNS